MSEELKVKRSYAIPENEMVIIKDTNTLLHNIVDSELKEKDKEIERLNDLINELERDFERKIQSCTIEAETTTNDFYCRLHIATLKRWLNKIKELKGVDNSE